MALLVTLMSLIAAFFLSGCGAALPSVVDPLKGNQPYDSAEGDQPMDLREGKPVYIWPVSSPDGRRIVFVSNRDGNTELYVMNADGSNPRRLSDNAERDDYAAWHPDGRHVVVVSDRAGRFDA